MHWCLRIRYILRRDITTENEVVAAIDNSHICAEAAFDDVCNKLIQLFSSMDNPDMQQRVTDIQDMRETNDTDIAGNESV